MEYINQVLYTVVNLLVKSGTESSLPPAVLHNLGRLTETLHKVYAFMEAQQDGNKIRHFFRQRLQQALDVFKIHHWANSLHNSSNSISMLPAKPKIFHGRESELKHVVEILHQESARIAILGAGGMGKTSLAKAALHHPDIVSKYPNRFFVAADSATNSIELAALIGLHLGLKPGKDLTKPVVYYFSNKGPSLLVLDNLETLWEPIESRGGIEEFLSSLTDVLHLALMITMRGAERPAKPLDPLSDEAAHQTFIAIAEDFHDSEDITKLLALADNMPLAVDLIAHLVDHEGCEEVLTRWVTEKTSLLSSGHDRRSNLDMSITISLSSPRLRSGAKDLLSLLSILPDGLSDAELLQSKLSIKNILECRSMLLRTSLAYEDARKRLKSLVPIREHMQQFHPAPPPLIHQVEKHLHLLLNLFHSRLYHPIVNPEQLIAQAICHFGKFNDLLLESKFYSTVGEYSFFNGNISRANQFLDKALVLAKSCGNKKQQATVLNELAMVSWNIGEYPAAQIHARGAQRLAQLSADLHRESYALQIEAMCVQELGDYKKSMFLCHRERKLLELCGMSQGILNYSLMINEAETHLRKSEYVEARRLQAAIVGNNSTQNAYLYAFGLLNLAHIDIIISASTHDVHKNLDKAREIFTAAGNIYGLNYCEMFSGELNPREKEMDTAKLIFQKYFNLLWQSDVQAALSCLKRLGNTSQWPACDFQWASRWTVVYLAYARRKQNKWALHKALQFLGDIFLTQGDLNTADSLFTSSRVHALPWGYLQEKGKFDESSQILEGVSPTV
ncbi:hypothetical protein C8R44DRAFT_951456 [Mycena epipterygia]|nr:hypothetical protein C8R44DRAFT_951456 [Mycena epipterygia]